MGNSFSATTYYQKILVNVNTTKTPSPKTKNIRENVKKFHYIKALFTLNTQIWGEYLFRSMRCNRNSRLWQAIKGRHDNRSKNQPRK